MKKQLVKIIIAAVIYALANLLTFPNQYVAPILFVAAYIVVGHDVIIKAIQNIARKNVFSEHLLMTIATVGAFGVGEWPESVAVMLFYQIGVLFQSYAVGKSRRSIDSVLEMRPNYANLKTASGIEKVDPEDVKIGDIIIIKSGEKVPLDCQIIEGSSTLDTIALTGESLPSEVEIGDEILSGSINLEGFLVAEVTKDFEQSTASQILELVENASSKKSPAENFISKFARYYTPIVVAAALFLAFVPPLVIPGAIFTDWIYRAFSFLVVACPCALVISIPLSFFGGIGGAAKKGILVKGSNYLEALARTKTIIFDKTGTLTKGVFKVQKISSCKLDEQQILEVAAYAESSSSHPIALSLRQAYGKQLDFKRLQEVKDYRGYGVEATIDGQKVLAGNDKLMKQAGLSVPHVDEVGTLVHVAINNQYAGYILICDELKDDARQAIDDLKAVHIEGIIMLSGDNKRTGEQVAAELGLDRVYTDLLPQDKVCKLEELLEEHPNGKTVFVGDGLNDAPALARADVGIAMGALGSDAAIEAADVVIMHDEPSKIATAIKIARHTLNIARQNIVIALLVKGAILGLCAAGLADMWGAVFADVGVMIIAVLNSFRSMYVKRF